MILDSKVVFRAATFTYVCLNRIFAYNYLDDKTAKSFFGLSNKLCFICQVIVIFIARQLGRKFVNKLLTDSGTTDVSYELFDEF